MTGTACATAAGATAAVLLAAPAVAGVQPPLPVQKAALAAVVHHHQAPPAHPAGSTPAHRHRVAVRPGDSLSAIGARHGLSWQVMWEANRRHITNPNLIYPGQVLAVPRQGDSAVLEARYRAHPWVAPVVLTRARTSSPGRDGDGDSDHDTSDSGTPAPRHAAPAPAAAPVPVVSVSGGVFSCAGLESLWEQAGGPAGVARLMAAIAMAESGGNSRAYNPSGASGLWQILGVPFPGDPFSPGTNAAMAVSKYRSQGLGAWETYTTGAYAGRC